MERKILNNKEIKRVFEKLEEQFGISVKIDLGVLKDKHGKLFLITKDINKVDFSKLRINELGLYFAKDDSEIRLTIEGTQLFGEHATKNVYEIDKSDTYFWMTGEDISCSKDYNGFVIIKHKDDYLGCGKCKDKKIINFIPKERRIK
ncbi:MAG: hypothetical protein AABW56_01300 [Nanoarchaeota archaeon]